MRASPFHSTSFVVSDSSRSVSGLVSLYTPCATQSRSSGQSPLPLFFLMFFFGYDTFAVCIRKRNDLISNTFDIMYSLLLSLKKIESI